MTNKKRAILQIGGSILQQDTLRWAQEAGLHVLLTDQNPAAFLRETADAFANIDAADAAGILSQAQTWQNEYELVDIYCGGDFGLMTAALVAETLGIPHCSPQAVSTALNKEKALQAFRAAGLTIPQRIAPRGEPIQFPVVVKPVDSSGSRGVSVVQAAEDLAQAIAHAQKYSANYLIETWIDGQHIDVNGIFWNDRFHGGEIIEREFSPLPYRCPTGMTTPPRVCSAEQRQAIYHTLEAAARALGITHGPVKGDFIVAGTTIHILEISPRFHGETNTFAAPLAYGTCTARIFVEALANGHPPDCSCFARPGKIAGWHAIFPKHGGRIKAILGVEQAQAVAGVSRIVLRRGPGYPIAAVKDNTAVIGFIYASASDYDALNKLLADARSLIEVHMENAS